MARHQLGCPPSRSFLARPSLQSQERTSASSRCCPEGSKGGFGSRLGFHGSSFRGYKFANLSYRFRFFCFRQNRRICFCLEGCGCLETGHFRCRVFVFFWTSQICLSSMTSTKPKSHDAQSGTSDSCSSLAWEALVL